jgi:hypothetical protein
MTFTPSKSVFANESKSCIDCPEGLSPEVIRALGGTMPFPMRPTYLGRAIREPDGSNDVVPSAGPPIFAILLLIGGCTPAPTKPIVEYKTVSVPTYIREPIPAAYTADRIVTEPQPLCVLAGPPKLIVYCQNQVAELVDAYRAALKASNLDKAALRSLDQQPEKTP